MVAREGVEPPTPAFSEPIVPVFPTTLRVAVGLLSTGKYGLELWSVGDCEGWVFASIRGTDCEEWASRCFSGDLKYSVVGQFQSKLISQPGAGSGTLGYWGQVAKTINRTRSYTKETVETGLRDPSCPSRSIVFLLPRQTDPLPTVPVSHWVGTVDYNCE